MSGVRGFTLESTGTWVKHQWVSLFLVSSRCYGNLKESCLPFLDSSSNLIEGYGLSWVSLQEESKENTYTWPHYPPFLWSYARFPTDRTHQKLRTRMMSYIWVSLPGQKDCIRWGEQKIQPNPFSTQWYIKYFNINYSLFLTCSLLFFSILISS